MHGDGEGLARRRLSRRRADVGERPAVRGRFPHRIGAGPAPLARPPEADRFSRSCTVIPVMTFVRGSRDRIRTQPRTQPWSWWPDTGSSRAVIRRRLLQIPDMSGDRLPLEPSIASSRIRPGGEWSADRSQASRSDASPGPRARCRRGRRKHTSEALPHRPRRRMNAGENGPARPEGPRRNTGEPHPDRPGQCRVNASGVRPNRPRRLPVDGDQDHPHPP